MESHPVPMNHGSLTGRTMLGCKTIHIHDVLADPEYKMTEIARIGRYRTLLGVPLMREGTPIGVISLQRFFKTRAASLPRQASTNLNSSPI
jgi:signal transduction protein with GAF and PtsI domain